VSEGPKFLLRIDRIERNGTTHATIHPAALKDLLSHPEVTILPVRGDVRGGATEAVAGLLFVQITEDATVPRMPAEAEDFYPASLTCDNARAKP